MKPTIIAVLVIVAAAVIGAATMIALSDDHDDGKDTVAVTMSWEKDIVESIVGDGFRVVSMMGSNISPHEAYSTPGNISSLYGSKLYFKIGSGVEWETAFFDSVAKDLPGTVRIVSIADKIQYQPLGNPGGHRDGESEEGSDPHIWTSPDILRKVARLVADEVSALDPGNTAEYEKNLSEYDKKADSVDAKMAAVAELAGSEPRNVMTWHPAWQYFLCQYAERFGTGFHMDSVEADGEVTPSEAARMIKDEGCSSVYVSTTDEGYEGRSALESSGIKVRVVNPTADDMLASVAEFLGYLEADLRG